MAKNPFSLEGKTAIVTGGGTGIGKSIAIEFAKAGADVAICSRKLEHLEPVVKAIRDLGRRSFAMAQGGGVIVNIASIAGVYGSTMMSHYGAAKAAVIMLTRELGTAWARKGVRVNGIAPGPVETEGYLEVLTKTDPEAEKTYKAVAARVGMGRWGRVEEIAHPCIFLASDASSWMTGETIVVDGGPAPREMEG